MFSALVRNAMLSPRQPLLPPRPPSPVPEKRGLVRPDRYAHLTVDVSQSPVSSLTPEPSRVARKPKRTKFY